MNPIGRFCLACVGPVLLVAWGGLFASQSLADDLRLTERQDGLANRYQQLEELLLRLAEVEAVENPQRSALLRRAARQSRDKFVLEKLRTASKSLQTQEFQKAVDNQTAATQELNALLQLLMSEDRSKRIRDEKEQYLKLAKELRRTIRAQQSTRARTENGADLEEVQGEQDAIGDRTEKLTDQLSEENQNDLSGDQQSDDQQSGDKQNDDQQNDDQENGDQENGDQENGDQEPSDSNADPKDGSQSQSKPNSPSLPSEQGQPSQQSPNESPPGSQSQDSQQQSSQQQSGSDSAPQTPQQQVEEQLRKAIERMREAEAELEKQNREGATEQQRAAEDELRAAIDRLETILRQLREEEKQRELARLESRLRKMAAMQSNVLDDTIALAATPRAQRNRQTDLKAGDLSFEEKKITLEADRALLLLREEGSSVAFPEVVSQISRDTTRVADFLAETKLDDVTQGIQRDILAALEEMIAATQQAQRDLEQQRQQQQQQGQQAGQQEDPLVAAIAELKLIRTMESRIKSTTERYSGMVESGDESADDILPLLQDLSERQNRLYRITRDLVLKRNQ